VAQASCSRSVGGSCSVTLQLCCGLAAAASPACLPSPPFRRGVGLGSGWRWLTRPGQSLSPPLAPRGSARV